MLEYILAKNRILFILPGVTGLGIILGLLLAVPLHTVTASPVDYTRYCQVNLQGVQTASLFDQNGSLLGYYPLNQSALVFPGSGNGSSGSDAVFILPFGTISNRLIIQQDASTTFTLRVTYYEDQGTGESAIPRYMVVFSDIPLGALGSAMADINCTSELGGMRLYIDQTGDQVADESRTPDGILTEKQIQDQIAPVTVIKTEANPFGLFLTDMVEVHLEPRDTGSGILKTEYSLDAGVTWLEYQQPFRVSVDSTPYVFARSVDMVGNQEYPWAYKQLTPSTSVPTTIWLLVGLDGVLLVIALLSLFYLKALLKERKTG